MPARSHNSNLVGDFKSVEFLGKDHVGLLFAAGGDECVYFAYLDCVELLGGFLDHRLGGAFVDNKNESVVVFNSLDGAFSTSGALDNGVLVPGVNFLDTV